MVSVSLRIKNGPGLPLAVLALLAVALIRLGVKTDDARMIMADLTTATLMYILLQHSRKKK
ncbi:hypothetical protein Mth01_38060 [Sphaerimonospora thailandensis]|uniref:Uncharacterized protein n=1 Tax=Sphaerimonospora thailandensis TaxID=795644 RepID=A0A8J3W0X8_9ACTN|nr:hypothetical protein Mth01_38060 [Sphaerimonospora thailandensis]